MVLILNENDVERVLPISAMDKVMEKVEKAFKEYGKGNAQMPPKQYLFFKQYNGDLRIMPAYIPSFGFASTKIVNVHPDNPKQGLDTVMAIIVLNDPSNGLPVAVMSATHITRMRTGAVAGVATKYLARKDSEILAVIGAGAQAMFQIASVVQASSIRSIMIYDIDVKKAMKLGKIANQMFGINCKVMKKVKEVREADIVCSVTPVRKPIIKAEWIKPGTHINAIGADAPGKQEYEIDVLKNAKIVVDGIEQASHAGEINVAWRKGIIGKDDIYAELGQIVAGIKKGRKSSNEITLFDSTGLAIQDLAAAVLVYKLARKKHIGKELKI